MRSTGIGGSCPPSRDRLVGAPEGSCGSSPIRSRPRTADGAWNLNGGGSAFAREAISGAFESRISGSRTPACFSHRRPSCDSAAAWNVRASTPSTPRPARRCLSSPAAFSVNVTARTCAAGNARTRPGTAIRCVIVVVLPVPAPARIATGAWWWRARPRVGRGSGPRPGIHGRARRCMGRSVPARWDTGRPAFARRRPCSPFARTRLRLVA